MLLYTRLERSFSPDRLFMDVDSIAPGDDFVKILRDKVQRCDVLLAILGKEWLNARDGAGNRRLDDPLDFVRIEIEQALQLGKRVIPILVGEAAMPRPDQVPDSLKPLVQRHAVRFSHDRFRIDADNLEKTLDKLLATPVQPVERQGAAAPPINTVKPETPLADAVAAAGPRAASVEERAAPGRWRPPAMDTADERPRLPLPNWQRAAILAAASTAVYLSIAALGLLVMPAIVSFSINATYEYGYSPAYDFGLVVSVSLGLFLFAGLSVERSIVALVALSVLPFVLDLAIQFCASQAFATSTDFYGGGTLGPGIWFVYQIVFATGFMLGVSLFCPAVRTPITFVPTVLLSAAVLYYFSSAGSSLFPVESPLPSFGLVICQIIVAASCGWSLKPAGPAAG
jgi:hypothetical protein